MSDRELIMRCQLSRGISQKAIILCMTSSPVDSAPDRVLSKPPLNACCRSEKVLLAASSQSLLPVKLRLYSSLMRKKALP